LSGDPITLATSTGSDVSDPLGFSAAATGTVAYRVGHGAPVQTSWFDRTGKVFGQLATWNAPELSPDGRYVAGDRTIDGNRDVWLLELARGASTRFTTHQAVDGFPVWSPDGSRIAFHSQRNGSFDVWMKRLNGAAGTEELLVGTPDNEWPLDWSRDGRFLLYHRSDQDYAGSDLWALPMTGNTRDPIVVANTPFEERLGQFSPDGRWIVYQTNESGRREIVVQAFPEASAPVHISTRGGVAPRWSADGTEIYFVGLDGRMMAVPVAVKGTVFSVGDPATLFFAGLMAQVFKAQYAVTRDGQFLINRLMDEGSASPITLIVNWKP
jgi:Tol biopolymer transport system component